MTPMRWVCYLGTRGCPGVLEQALRQHFGPVEILVPAEPRLLGACNGDAGVAEGLGEVASILAERAYERAVDLARSDEGELSGVFGEQPDVEDRIETRVLEPPLEDALAEAAEGSQVQRCFLSRDGLDVLDEAGIRPGDALASHGIELVTR